MFCITLNSLHSASKVYQYSIYCRFWKNKTKLCSLSRFLCLFKKTWRTKNLLPALLLQSSLWHPPKRLPSIPTTHPECCASTQPSLIALRRSPPTLSALAAHIQTPTASQPHALYSAFRGYLAAFLPIYLSIQSPLFFLAPPWWMNDLPSDLPDDSSIFSGKKSPITFSPLNYSCPCKSEISLQQFPSLSLLVSLSTP